jgi:hypothetical protein
VRSISAVWSFRLTCGSRGIPLPAGDALSIGMTTVQRTACLGVYADHIDTAIDELLNLSL